MREILFRGKANSEIREGEWVYGSLLAETKNTFPIIARDYDNDEDWLGIDLWDTVDPYTVGQYTGLTDKNGKKIFEGDILSSSWGYKGIVGFDQITYAKLECLFNEDCEIIGNIHDNPELLEANDDER